MNKKGTIIISGLSFALGLSILMISLVKTSAVRALSQAEGATSHKQFYIGQELKPNHVLYPFRVAREKATLFMHTPEERVEKKIQYSQERMEFAKELLEKNEYQLSLATIIKSQQYLFEVAEYLESANYTHHSCQNLISSLEDDSGCIDQMTSKFPEKYHEQLRQLQDNQKGVVMKLQSIL